ncbi:heavy-metal resistance protein [Pacificibacter maritimus]|uniref:Heavy-metal resistance protein n=1 Tax=Pacificibacter maritimus TaxID=762213 RepID=A0A3N4UN34_9RHOB|nr:periplasmic heavy metal sensor [Pacificibacter maritimus]RPE72022.1 heavy-metal resistance protein [Pacificibacter maritimus]
MSDTKLPISKSSRPMRIVLIASLALNLAVVGLIAGAALRGDRDSKSGADRARVMQSRDIGFGPYVAAFEKGQKRSLGQAFIGKAGRQDKARNTVQAQFEDILAVLTAEPFDADAFKSAMLVQLNGLAELQQIGAEVITDQVAAMTPEARAVYAERLDQALTRPPRHVDGDRSGARDGKHSEPRLNGPAPKGK